MKRGIQVLEALAESAGAGVGRLLRFPGDRRALPGAACGRARNMNLSGW